VQNNNVRELSLNTLNSGNFVSLIGLDGFPKLEKLNIASCSHLSKVVDVLNSYEHQIHTIDIKSCGGINNTEIMTYCQKNNIKLTLA
jgi:hypothetical protein